VFQVDFLQDISDDKLCSSLEEFEAEQNANDSAVRFAILNDDELHEIVRNSESKGTKKNTRWCVKMFEGKDIARYKVRKRELN